MSADERIEELLVQRAVEGLTSAEQNELDGLLAEAPNVDTARFESAAALVLLATADPHVRMPASLAETLLSRAGSMLE